MGPYTGPSFFFTKLNKNHLLGDIMKFRSGNKKGFTLVELLVVAAIIGILIAIAVPNLLKARQSANEANARKAMQTLRDAEGQFYEQDLDDSGSRDFTNAIGDDSTNGSLRFPSLDGSFSETNALVDSTFERADTGISSGTGDADCSDPKAGYCFAGDFDDLTKQSTSNPNGGYQDFGWESSPVIVGASGRKDFYVYGDGVIRCTLSSQTHGSRGQFDATKGSSGCD